MIIRIDPALLDESNRGPCILCLLSGYGQVKWHSHLGPASTAGDTQEGHMKANQLHLVHSHT